MVTLTHPASWGPYKRELFAQVPGLAGLGEVRMLTEPEAAAAHYARSAHLDPGALVAVYDLGGGTFDATVLRTAERGFDILGRPEGIEGLGGVDFDEAVFTHVDRALDGAVSRLDPADPRATSAAIRLRHECVTAKETLSADTETTIAVLLPGLQTEVRLTRGEFEKMIRPAIDATIASLRRALHSARVDPRQLHTVLLVGGSSRIPLVAHLVSAELGRPTSVDTHPKHAIALGAAAAGAETAAAAAAAAARQRQRRSASPPPAAGQPRPAGPSAPAPRPPLPPSPPPSPPPPHWRPQPAAGTAACAAPPPAGQRPAHRRPRQRRNRRHPRTVQPHPRTQPPNHPANQPPHRTPRNPPHHHNPHPHPHAAPPTTEPARPRGSCRRSSSPPRRPRRPWSGAITWWRRRAAGPASRSASASTRVAARCAPSPAAP